MFGLLDLEGNTMAGAAGAMAPQILMGADQIAMSALNAEKAKHDMLRQARADTVDEMLLPIKVGTDSMTALQKLNILSPEPTQEDMATAFEELSASIPGFQSYPPEQIQSAVTTRATDIAKARRPEMDPFNPTPFLNYGKQVGISDLEAQILKNRATAESRFILENLRQDAQTNRTWMQGRTTLDAVDKRVQSAQEIADAKRRAEEAKERRQLAEKQRREREVRGQTLYDNALRRFSPIAGRNLSQVSRHQRQALLGAYDSMAEFPEFQAQFLEAVPLLGQLLGGNASTPAAVNQSIQSATGTRRPRNLSQMRRAEPAVVGPPQPSPRDVQAMEWLKNNPDDKNAPAVRESLKRKGLL
jgi:hypothetical protein